MKGPRKGGPSVWAASCWSRGRTGGRRATLSGSGPCASARPAEPTDPCSRRGESSPSATAGGTGRSLSWYSLEPPWLVVRFAWVALLDDLIFRQVARACTRAKVPKLRDGLALAFLLRLCYNVVSFLKYPATLTCDYNTGLKRKHGTIVVKFWDI